MQRVPKIENPVVHSAILPIVPEQHGQHAGQVRQEVELQVGEHHNDLLQGGQQQVLVSVGLHGLQHHGQKNAHITHGNVAQGVRSS